MTPSQLEKLSEKKVENVVKFFTKYLSHTKGKWAGCKFNLLPWQLEDVIVPTFGTLKPNGMRQYRTVYVEIPKKNGKTELAAGLALYGLTADGEHGAEVYSAAGDREQAALVYYPAEQMVRKNKNLAGRIDVLNSRKRMIYHQTGSFYQVLSSEVFTKHGLNPHFVIFDEIHAQPNRELYDVLVEGTDAAREQQLIFIITTAGVYDKNSIGWEVHNYATQVKKGVIDDPTFLPIIYAIDDEVPEGSDKPNEDWEDEKVWRRTNPSIDYIFDMEKIRNYHRDAKNNPARLNNFLRYRLNKWVGQIDRWLPMDKWDLCNDKVDEGKLLGRPCFGGLDLSSSTDLSSFVLVFPPVKKGEKFKIVPKFYVPAEAIEKRSKKDRVPYPMWRDAGLITAIPGEVINYDWIKKDVINANKIYNLIELAFDRWGSTQIALDLGENEGIEMVKHGQGFADMSAPTKELLNYTLQGNLAHGGNPVLRWNADNVAVKQDAAENYKPDKEHSRERIDGIVALIMALGRAIANPDFKSVYDDRGIIFI